MQRLDDLEAFVAIVDTGSQAAAARVLERTPQSIARSLALLEAGVGVALIRRTTRQSSPTESGVAFYARVKPALTEIDRGRTEAADAGRTLTGRLRIAAPLLFARAFVTPAICDFLERYPQVQVDLRASDRAVDLLGEGLDLAVRVRRLPDSSLKARRIGELRLVAFAARSYLRRHGRPAHPDELAAHACIVRAGDGGDEAWQFTVDGRRRSYPVAGRLRSNDTTTIVAAVIRGLGIGFGPLWQVREAVAAGIVELVLTQFEPGPLPIQAVFPPTRVQPTKVRRFVDLLAVRLEAAEL